MAPMQWPGTSGVLERRTDVPDGSGLSGPERDGAQLGGTGLSDTGLSDMAFNSQMFANAELPCRDDPELFFAESPEDVEFAKSLCGSCALKMVCLAGAIARAEPWGVWGGELFLRGEIVPRKRPRGRPRKDAVAA
jgi:WhiB family transcriptional regulator, redox-sensing transcriptional regulator